MSWMNMLYQTFENNKALVGKTRDAAVLAPVAHMLANAQLEITLDSEGILIDISIVDKEDAKTIIPVTESSGGRANSIEPHALSDMLPYVAGDYADYVANTKEADKCKAKYDKYISALRLWNNSEYSHPKVSAIYTYLSQGKLIDDLLKRELIEIENGVYSSSKISGQPYEKVMVRFIVLSNEIQVNEKAWKDLSLMQAYTRYYTATMENDEDICYITGKHEKLTYNHPKGIVAAQYGAKLISANDETNFTFRGRFITSEEACSVGYVASQKAHNALRWLAEKQGTVIGIQDKRTFICWNPGNKKVPDMNSSNDLFEDEDEVVSTQEQYKAKLRMVIDGYSKDLKDNDDIVVIALDAATTGRLSVTYYNELKAADFLARIQHWNSTCCWFFSRKDKFGNYRTMIQTPSPKDIVKCAYGNEGTEFIEVSDKILKGENQRILCCILNQMSIPWDLVSKLAQKASSPLAYKKKYNYSKVLSVACAIIMKYYNDRRNGGVMSMKLDNSITDRSYLFGRILAIAERVEWQATKKENNRTPNAIRLQAAYVNHPYQTWSVLETMLIPYYDSLGHRSANYYKKMIGEVLELLPMEDVKLLNKSLEPMYLLGYYLQRNEMWGNKEKDSEEKEDE